jgi:hypothetical protein
MVRSSYASHEKSSRAILIYHHHYKLFSLMFRVQNPKTRSFSRAIPPSSGYLPPTVAVLFPAPPLLVVFLPPTPMAIVPFVALSITLSASARPGTIALAQGDLGIITLLPLSAATLPLPCPTELDLTIAFAHGVTTLLARPLELVLLERVGASTVPFVRVDVEFERAGCGWDESG